MLNPADSLISLNFFTMDPLIWRMAEVSISSDLTPYGFRNRADTPIGLPSIQTIYNLSPNVSTINEFPDFIDRLTTLDLTVEEDWFELIFQSLRYIVA